MTHMLPHSPTPPLLWREALGRALRLRRTDMGLTLAQVSERSGVSTQFLSEIERGLKDPSSEVIEAVAAVLGMQLPQILVLAAVGMTSGVSATTLLSAADMTRAAPSPPAAGQVRLALAA
ncbi:helix-turn-helix transcriptional regulator [Brevibacterium sp. S22]|uniref:helix-turn-helix domain-containing protein n=1 Tax=Brevibacterium sp. S22 TaxID=2483794 RepID=UPI001F0E2113|nr:helix-turn-helix transcriptional regulator [Brevibacterium sp. S22]